MSVHFVVRPSTRALLLACAAAALVPAAHAQEPVGDDETSITVTGRRISQSSEAIGEDKVSNVVVRAIGHFRPEDAGAVARLQRADRWGAGPL